jgi:DNA-binding response OmpR family regulator
VNRHSTSLFGRNILVVENEYLTAASLDQELAILGATVTIAGSCREAIKVIETQAFDLAVLDINLPDGMSYGVARHLQLKGTPFVFVSGFGHADGEFANAPLMQKPVDRSVLTARLGALL